MNYIKILGEFVLILESKGVSPYVILPPNYCELI